ncbi:hypothetical protein CR203_16895 [Salipaludibacillus neizhouensis]|uniref:ABC transporter substrate-binding protein n=1 Tax=Salipaludibacillus neizhouensis TaxID=885475 RepID=A0A3A9K1J0_9BACI|nr:extracellular solute-binding protein [Salipaludibacillus neizhouensis]RKL66229.1 hypothetical protein CR203_16895 [Salipaludibacillus neizhouensis]
MKKTSLGISLGLFVFLLAGCNNDSNSEANADADSNSDGGEERLSVSIMAPSFAAEPAGEDSPALQAIEEYTNTDIDLQFVANANYEDRFNVTLASGEFPEIMVANKEPSFINAARDGAFWDLTDHLDDYENLSQANEIVLNNTTIDGRIYGVYRARPLGRNGAAINKQWLDNLGLEMPETIEEFHEVLRAFTNDDPNQSGKDDTYGMVVSEWEGPWNTMQVWMGAPNQWGFDENNKLAPDFTFDEYREALVFFKELYDEGLVNEDFAVMDSGQWTEPLVNQEAGVFVDVLDAANRIQNQITEGYTEENQILDVFGAVEGPHGLHTLPTAGYAGMLAISKTAVETEEELKRVLQFLDDLNDEEVQNLAYIGVEGVHHEIVDGVLDITSQADGGTKFESEVSDLNQFQMAIPEENFMEQPQTALQEKAAALMEENMEFVVANPAEPLISPTYTERGQQLDNIIDDARIQYIVGQIDDAEFDAEIERWMGAGGTEYIAEINQAYEESQAAE